MCSIVLAYRVFPGYDVVVAANRDEVYGREYEAPMRRDIDGWAMTPLDLEAGGTWIGYNSHGVFAVIANVYPRVTEEPSRSRGLLCRDVLRQESALEARDVVSDSVEREVYDGFNLVVADSSEAWVAVNNESLQFLGLDPGFHVFTNGAATDPDNKASEIRNEVPENRGLWDWLGDMKPVLMNHDLDVCRHGDGRGTTSSSIVAVDSTGVEDSFYLWLDGHPCESEYNRVT